MNDVKAVSSDSSKSTKLLARTYTDHERLIKYVLIGGTASAIDVLIFLFLYNAVGTTVLVAHSVAVPTAVLFSFVANARHNFKTNDYWLLRMTLFCVVCCVGYAVGYLIIQLVLLFANDANVGKLASLPFVFVTQYVLNSQITFRDARNC